ncbi:hypothetical protein L873DRAFT_1486335 [Choiromyces venosus 120613-1]|uniref:G domain-containing protein n=1 Tax=Choiromyces venosus 120613-1 TaxID=1336337 RepID=A0A3N4JJC2_9PEZI|nr:hypothetical protein L873DRAFT_1486335 [Choiromyces venosus 120613-1]
MGVSGAGKSSFIKVLGGKDPKGNPPETSDTESVTHEVAVYKTTLDGQEMLLVDTPGFEDNKTSNLKTLQKICEHVVQLGNNPACEIYGVVYIHSISIPRWLAGDNRTWGILVATTRWPKNHGEKEYEKFEKLEKKNWENYWKGILGAARLAEDDVQSSTVVIQMLLGVRPHIFQVQWELSNGRTPSDTSAGRIAMSEAEQELIKAEEEKEAALVDLKRVSLQVQRLQSQNAPKPTQPPPPAVKKRNAANYKTEMDALLVRLKSAINADKALLEKIKMSEETLQEEIQQVQASVAEKEKLLKNYTQLRRKIESADNLKTRLGIFRMPISIRKISMGNLLTTLGVGGTLLVEVGSGNIPFYGFAVLGGVLLYRGVRVVNSPHKAKKVSKTSRKAGLASGMEHQVPVTNTGQGGKADSGSDGDDEGEERRLKELKMKKTGVEEEVENGVLALQEPSPSTAPRRSSWFSFWWT